MRGLLGGKDLTGRFFGCPLSEVRSPLSVANERMLQTMDYGLARLIHADQAQVVHKPIGEQPGARISEHLIEQVARPCHPGRRPGDTGLPANLG